MMFSKQIKKIEEIQRNNNGIIFARILDLNNEKFCLNCKVEEFVKIFKSIEKDGVAEVVVNIYDSKYNNTWRRNFWVNFDG